MITYCLYLRATLTSVFGPQQKRDASKKGSVAAKVLEDSRSCVMVVTTDSLLGGLDYELKLGGYRDWIAKARGQ